MVSRRGVMISISNKTFVEQTLNIRRPEKRWRMGKKLMKCLIFIKHVELCLDDSFWIEMTNLWFGIYEPVAWVLLLYKHLSGIGREMREERRLNETNLHNAEYDFPRTLWWFKWSYKVEGAAISMMNVSNFVQNRIRIDEPRDKVIKGVTETESRRSSFTVWQNSSISQQNPKQELSNPSLLCEVH